MSSLTPVRRQTVVLWWIGTLTWMAIIFAFSSQPDADPVDRRLHTAVYKLAHLLFFGVLGILTAGATRHLVLRPAWWAWVVVALYAIGDEIHQAFVPGRSPLLTDVGIDSLGGLLGILLFALIAYLRWHLFSPLWRLLLVRARP